MVVDEIIKLKKKKYRSYSSRNLIMLLRYATIILYRVINYE